MSAGGRGFWRLHGFWNRQIREDAIAAAGLCQIEQLVSRIEMVAERLAVFHLDDTDRNRDGQRPAADGNFGLLDLAAQLLAEGMRLEGVEMVEVEGKFLAAEAGCDMFGLVAAARHHGRDLLQHAIAGIMAIGVVDMLEVVDVEKRDRAVEGLPLQIAHAGEEVPTVGKAVR